MLHLGTNDSIAAVMGGSAATTNPSVLVRSAVGGQPRSAASSLNGATAVTLLSGSATGGADVQLDTISIANIDTQSNTITISATIGSNTVNFAVITMAAGDQITVDSTGKITGVNSAGQNLAQTLGASTMTFTTINAATATLAIAGLAAAQGGTVNVTGGASGASNNNGGPLNLRGGAHNGSGVDGVLSIGDATTSAINLGAASIPTTIAGPLTETPGGSTAAAGSTTTDAGVLPAGTAAVYPTTAADDTKGVRVHANDKVTGRMLFIGNGVSNKILKAYGPSGATINGGAADAAFSSVSGKGIILYCLSGAGNSWLGW